MADAGAAWRGPWAAWAWRRRRTRGSRGGGRGGAGGEPGGPRCPGRLVPREACRLRGGQRAWVLRAGDSGGKSTFEPWPRGGDAGQRLGAAPPGLDTPRAHMFLSWPARAPRLFRCHLKLPHCPFLVGHPTCGRRQGHHPVADSGREPGWLRPGRSRSLTWYPEPPSPAARDWLCVQPPC